MRISLSEILTGKFIICSCEGAAEHSIIDLLLDNGKVCFDRSALIDGECTEIRNAQTLAANFLTRDYSKDIVFLRILDRENEPFVLPYIYRKFHNYASIDVVTKPEIEILHIIAEGVLEDFQREQRLNKKLNASGFFQSYVNKKSRKRIKIKTAEFVKEFYENDIEKLICAIKKYHQQANQMSYDLSDLLLER